MEFRASDSSIGKLQEDQDLIPQEKLKGNRCFISKLLTLTEAVDIVCGLDGKDCHCCDQDPEYYIPEDYPVYAHGIQPTSIFESSRNIKTGVLNARQVPSPTTTMPFGVLHRVKYAQKDPPSAHPVYKQGPLCEGDTSGPWHYGVASAPANTVPWNHSTPPPVPEIHGPDMRTRDAYYIPPRPRLHYNEAVHKMLAGDCDAGSFIIGSPDRAIPHIAAMRELRNSTEARAFFDAHYKRPAPPKPQPPPSWTASDFPKITPKDRMAMNTTKSNLTELLQNSCTDHAICIYLRVIEQLKAARQASTRETRYTREILLNVSEQLRELEILNPGLGETITTVTTTNGETGKREQKRRTLRKAVEKFLESCQTVEDRASQIIEKLDQKERLRANTIEKLKTENSVGHDTSVSRARELLARVIESSFLDRELKRLATKTLVQLEELENCHTSESQSRVAAMIHSVLENYM